MLGLTTVVLNRLVSRGRTRTTQLLHSNRHFTVTLILGLLGPLTLVCHGMSLHAFPVNRNPNRKLTFSPPFLTP